jgi:5-methylthioadenosine/S-adenosylhomocysteine deaminase
LVWVVLDGMTSLTRDAGARTISSISFPSRIIDLTGRNTLRYGPVRNPVKSAVECGVGDDMDTVIVNGKTVMEGGIIPGVDFAKLRHEAQSAGEQIWSTLQRWDPLDRMHEDACLWRYRVPQ